jgi:hypothetical protein
MLALVIKVHKALLLFLELAWSAESASESILIFILVYYLAPSSADRKDQL